MSAMQMLEQLDTSRRLKRWCLSTFGLTAVSFGQQRFVAMLLSSSGAGAWTVPCPRGGQWKEVGRQSMVKLPLSGGQPSHSVTSSRVTMT